MHPIDLARAVGVSTQTIRKYEAEGFLPPAIRSISGYRAYTERHLQALHCARLLIAGYGWNPAREILRMVHRGNREGAVLAAHACHSRLYQEQSQVLATLAILRTVSELLEVTVPAREVRLSLPRWRNGLYISEVADLLGVAVSAVWFWEQQGLLSPQRDAGSGYRLFSVEQVQRVRMIMLLRQAGYSIADLPPILTELDRGDINQTMQAMQGRVEELAETSLRCLAAAGALSRYLEEFDSGRMDSQGG